MMRAAVRIKLFAVLVEGQSTGVDMYEMVRGRVREGGITIATTWFRKSTDYLLSQQILPNQEEEIEKCGKKLGEDNLLFSG